MTPFPCNSVEIFRAETGCLRSYPDDAFPCDLQAWNAGTLVLEDDATHYGFVGSLGGRLHFRGSEYPLTSGMYFCVPGSAKVDGDGIGMVASRQDWKGMFHLGGPIESTGRLRYIDGCSDSLLIGPPVMGDACLNLLHIPPDTRQSTHTHPSIRLGMVASGHGVCRTPASDFPLSAGDLFVIAAEAIHSFHTTVDSLRVIAWHPDSDCGPQHDNHPMINRTMIDGISAAQRDSA